MALTTENQTEAKRPVTAKVRAAEIARAITDGEIVLATIDLPAPPERVFQALMTNECERWWGAPGVYQTESWKADARAGGSWSLVTRLPDGTALPASGEFTEVSPSRVVQTRRYHFDYPMLGRRATKVTRCSCRSMVAPAWSFGTKPSARANLRSSTRAGGRGCSTG